MFAKFPKLDIMGQQLSPYGSNPVLECTGEEGTGTGFIYGVCSMQGWRKKQEDTYKCVIKYYEDYRYFAVFDGHGGSEVAKFLEKKLDSDIKEILMKKGDPELALQLGFLTCDASLNEPEGIAELNAYVEEDNQITGSKIENHRWLIQQSLAKFAERDSADDVTMEADTSISTMNDAGSTSSKDVGTAHAIDADGSVSKEVAGSNKNIAGCSKDIGGSSTAENMDDEEMDEDSSSSQESMPDEGKSDGVTDPLKYLLMDDLEETDSEDEDFDGDVEGSSSDNSHDGEDFANLQPGIHSGSTATVLLFDSRHYYCANVGDSRCVLCRDGKAIDMSIDHKPEDPAEEMRIKATGAVITDGRINKCLNLSRAFGDFSYKNASLAPFEQCVTVEPSIKTLPITPEDEFIIIASDGLWNSMSSQEVIDFVSIRLQEESNVRIIAEDLFRLILAPDTNGDGTGCDNITCIIILLDPSKLCSMKVEPHDLSYPVKIQLFMKK